MFTTQDRDKSGTQVTPGPPRRTLVNPCYQPLSFPSQTHFLYYYFHGIVSIEYRFVCCGQCNVCFSFLPVIYRLWVRSCLDTLAPRARCSPHLSSPLLTTTSLSPACLLPPLAALIAFFTPHRH